MLSVVLNYLGSWGPFFPPNSRKLVLCHTTCHLLRIPNHLTFGKTSLWVFLKVNVIGYNFCTIKCTCFNMFWWLLINLDTGVTNHHHHQDIEHLHHPQKCPWAPYEKSTASATGNTLICLQSLQMWFVSSRLGVGGITSYVLICICLLSLHRTFLEFVHINAHVSS